MSNQKVQTVELTSKRWKKLSILASLISFLALGLMLAGGATNSPATIVTGFFVFAVSIACAVIVRIGRWWENE